MHLTPLLATLALTATTLSAPSIIIHNACPFPIWVTSVSASTGPTSLVAPSTYWTQEEYFDKIGTAIKMTRKESDLWTAQPALHLGYTYKANESIYYDLSSAYGFNFWGQRISVQGDEGKGVAPIVWEGKPEPSHTSVFFGSTGLRVELCEKV